MTKKKRTGFRSSSGGQAMDGHANTPKSKDLKLIMASGVAGVRACVKRLRSSISLRHTARASQFFLSFFFYYYYYYSSCC
jgi:hypothetical protein